MALVCSKIGLIRGMQKNKIFYINLFNCASIIVISTAYDVIKKTIGYMKTNSGKSERFLPPLR